MAIERKFFVTGNGWKKAATSQFPSQVYLSHDPERSVRVRISADQARLTIKGMSKGNSRQEAEITNGKSMNSMGITIDYQTPG